MITKFTQSLLMAAGLLLIVSVAGAWAGSGSQCGVHSDLAAATDQHPTTGKDSPQMQGTENTGHAEKMKHMGQNDSMMDMSAVHGGESRTIGDLEFETVFTESDVRLFVRRSGGEPVDLESITATATVSGPTGEPQSIDLGIRKVSDDPVASHRHMSMRAEPSTSYLSAPYTFGTMPDEAVTVAFTVKSPGAEPVTWNQPFAMTPLFGVACPMHPEQAALSDGTCSLCGGMKMQPARVLYGCCPGCPDMRSTSPATCSKCGMEMKLKSVGTIDLGSLEMESPRHPNHAG